METLAEYVGGGGASWVSNDASFELGIQWCIQFLCKLEGLQNRTSTLLCRMACWWSTFPVQCLCWDRFYVPFYSVPGPSSEIQQNVLRRFSEVIVNAIYLICLGQVKGDAIKGKNLSIFLDLDDISFQTLTYCISVDPYRHPECIVSVFIALACLYPKLLPK